MKTSTYRWCVGGMLGSWCALTVLCAWLCGSVLINERAWMEMPAILTDLVFIVCSQIVLCDLQETRRSCVACPDWHDALPTGMAVAAVLMLLGVIWVAWFSCHELAGGIHGWLLIPIFGVLAVATAMVLTLIKAVCDRKEGEL